MGTIIVNGKTYQGDNVQIINDKVIIDGVEQDSGDVPEIKIEITGNIETLQTERGDITVKGDVGELTAKSGNIAVKGNVSGDVTARTGNISCGNVGGDTCTRTGNITHL